MNIKEIIKRTYENVSRSEAAGVEIKALFLQTLDSNDHCTSSIIGSEAELIAMILTFVEDCNKAEVMEQLLVNIMKLYLDKNDNNLEGMIANLSASLLGSIMKKQLH